MRVGICARMGRTDRHDLSLLKSAQSSDRRDSKLIANPACLPIVDFSVQRYWDVLAIDGIRVNTQRPPCRVR